MKGNLSDLQDIRQGNCLEVLKSLTDKSVDVVFTDPPYNAKKDYGVYKDNLPPEEYVAWMREVVFETRRIARKGVAFYVSGKLCSTYFSLIPDAHLTIVHKKAAGVLYQNFALQYHAIFSTVKPVKRTRDLWDDVRLPGEGYFFKEERYDNPGLTSLKLTEKFLEHFTVEGDIVADPFGGVGTTAVACQKMNRGYFLMELNPKYIEVAKERLARH